MAEPRPRRHLVVGTAGHIDHGKTALVKALTGVDTDRLAEEKRRGITIELGFAPWRLGPNLEASIVDVPGHERLVRTMVAGAGGMDIGLLVVAADDGVMPQTQEHLDVLRLLAVPAGLVILTKCDLVEPDLLELVEQDVRDTCRHTVFEDGPIVRTSSKTGRGLEEVTEQIRQLAERAPQRPDEGPVFLPLDRVFIKAGYGTVGTGTALRGRLTAGDAIEALGHQAGPLDGLKARGLQTLGASQDVVTAGMRVAVNLTGRATDQIRRGMTLAQPGVFRTGDSFVAWLEVLPRARALEEEIVTAHLGTTEREATVIPLGQRKITPGGSGGVLVRCSRPLATFAGQRLVLRRPGLHGQATIAGGVVLDPEPPRGKGAVSMAASQVEALRGSPRDRMLAVARESRAMGIDRASLFRRLPPGEGLKTLHVLEKKGALVRLSAREERWLDSALVNRLVKVVCEMVEEHHDAAPLSPGMAVAEVESRLPPPDRHLADLVVEQAVAAKKLTRDGAVLMIPGRGSAVDETANQQLEKIRRTYQEAGLMPPTDAETIRQLDLDPKRAKELLGLLRRRGILARVTETLHFDQQALSELEHKVITHLSREHEMNAPHFKTLAGGISRKWAIPLLEYLDRQRVTVRVGDLRRLHPSHRPAAPG